MEVKGNEKVTGGGLQGPRSNPNHRRAAAYLSKIKKGREMARTDLMFLVKRILGYDRFEEEVHGPAFRHLAQFGGGIQGVDRFNGSNYVYEPRAQDPADVLPPWPRRRIYMDPRGWYKTTGNVIGHSIQVLLNFPSCTIFLCHAQQEIINEKLREMKHKFFPGGSELEKLFPEFCGIDPKERMDRLWLPRECGARNQDAPNVSTSSITSTTAGMHYAWMKFTDIVEHQNSQTVDQRSKVRRSYHQFLNLLVSPRHFVDLEGTCYAYDDVYNAAIKAEMQREEEDKKAVYSMFVRGCFKKQPPVGHKEKFHPRERRWEFALNKDGQRMSRFPSQFPLEHYEVLEHEDPQEFANNQLNDPRMAMANAPFPVDKISWISPKELRHVNFTSFHLSVDTAETVTAQSDFTAMIVCGLDRHGRFYVVDGYVSRALPDEISRNLLRLYQKWNCQDCRIEKSSFNRGYYPSLKRTLDLNRAWVNFKWLQRDTQTTKPQRILGMQDAFKSGTLRFSTELPTNVKNELQVQFAEFPASAHDDLLDALADQFQERIIFGANAERASVKQVMERAQKLRLERQYEYDKIYPQTVDDNSSSLGSL